MATLKKVDDHLELNLSGPNFREGLARAKQIPGRRYDPEKKVWKFPATKEVAMRIVHTIQPQPDAVVMGWLREEAASIAEELTSALPDTADLLWRPPGELELFDFQPPAIDFLASAGRVLLADDMGLGKTIESIGAVQEYMMRLMRGGYGAADDQAAELLKQPHLVVAGSSKLGDWRDELHKWAPGEPVMTVPGDWSPKKRRDHLREFERNFAPASGWLVVNPEQLRAEDMSGKKRGKGDWVPKQPWFSEQEWAAAIVDEAHRFKNRDAQQTRGLWLVNAHLRFMLTGTAIIQHPGDLWALLAFLRPDAYEEWSPTKITYWQFFHAYVEAYDVPERGTVITGVKNADELRFELADKLVRRTKRLLRERGLLPDKLPTRVREVAMKPAQRKLYDEAQKDLWIAVEADMANLPDDHRRRLQAKIDAGDPLPDLLRQLPNAASRYAVAKQIATSPGLIGGKDISGKLDAVVEEVKDQEGAGVVIFTWHKAAAELIAARLTKAKVSAEFMHGDVPPLERTEIVRRYQDGETDALVATIKTGGEGLNLTRGSTALFAEVSDRLTDNDQAEDRLWRLGQQKDVNVIVFRSADTVEASHQAPRLKMKELIIGATMGRDRKGEV